MIVTQQKQNQKIENIQDEFNFFIGVNEINLSDHNQMMVRESTMKLDDQDDLTDNITLFTEKKYPQQKYPPYNKNIGPHIDDYFIGLSKGVFNKYDIIMYLYTENIIRLKYYKIILIIIKYNSNDIQNRIYFNLQSQINLSYSIYPHFLFYFYHLKKSIFQVEIILKASKQQFYMMQESLNEIDKYVKSCNHTKSDTTLSQGDYDMNSKYTKSKYTYNDLSSTYSAAIQTNDIQFIIKGELLDPNGNTYGALNQNTGHLYAVKTYKKDLFTDGFIVDQNAAEKWIDVSQKCINLCRCFTIFYQENGLDLIYEHISGESLQKIIPSFNNFQEKLIAIFARQFFKGLDFIHQQGLIHGNLKISNVLVDNDAIMKITDLNIFKITPQVLNYLKSTSSAPETLLRNELTAKSDIWSAGIVLLEMIAGNPWVLKTGDLMTKEQVIQTLSKNQRFQVPTKIKKEFQDFLNLVLQMDPNKRLTPSELLKHKFLKGKYLKKKKNKLTMNIYQIDVEQDEKSLLNCLSMKERTVYSQASISRKAGRTSSQQYQINTNSNQQSSYQHELKSFKSQKSEGAVSRQKYMNMQQQSKFHPTPSSSSIRDLYPDEVSHNRNDYHSPHDSKYSIPKHKSSLTKTPNNSMSRRVTHEQLQRGQTIGSKVSYIKMLSVGENESFVDDKSFSQSQMYNFIQHNPQATAIIIANSINEDSNERYDEDLNKNQVQDKLQFIEQRMNQIMENSDYPNSEMISIAPHSPVDNHEKTFSFIQVQTAQNINNVNNQNVNVNSNNHFSNNFSNNYSNNYSNTNSFTSQNVINMQNNKNQNKNQSSRPSSLILKVNDQLVDAEFYSNTAISNKYLK